MISKAWYVTCDSCLAPAEINTESAKQARVEARRADGFVRIGRRDLCADCAANALTDQQAPGER